MRFREALGLGAVSARAAPYVSIPPPWYRLSHVEMRIKNIQAYSQWFPLLDNKNRAVKRIKNIQADSRVPTL